MDECSPSGYGCSRPLPLRAPYHNACRTKRRSLRAKGQAAGPFSCSPVEARGPYRWMAGASDSRQFRSVAGEAFAVRCRWLRSLRSGRPGPIPGSALIRTASPADERNSWVNDRRAPAVHRPARPATGEIRHRNWQPALRVTPPTEWPARLPQPPAGRLPSQVRVRQPGLTAVPPSPEVNLRQRRPSPRLNRWKTAG